MENCQLLFASSKETPRLCRGKEKALAVKGVDKKKAPCKSIGGLPTAQLQEQGGLIVKDKDINSLEHTTWRCQYHIVFAPKFRRQVIYREIKVDIGKILRQLCQ